MAQDWASAHHASLPTSLSKPGVWQIFCYCSWMSFYLQVPAVAAAEGVPPLNESCTNPDPVLSSTFTQGRNSSSSTRSFAWTSTGSDKSKCSLNGHLRTPVLKFPYLQQILFYLLFSLSGQKPDEASDKLYTPYIQSWFYYTWLLMLLGSWWFKCSCCFSPFRGRNNQSQSPECTFIASGTQAAN